MNDIFDADAAAASLVDARQTGKPALPLSPSPATTRDAYAVQQAVMQRLGDPGGVWKMALLGGVDREASILPQAALADSGAQLALPSHAMVEVETALILAKDPGPKPDLNSIADIRLAFEIVATRFAAAPSPLQAMADSFNSVAVILGGSVPHWQDGLPDRLGIALTLDGQRIAATEAAAPLADVMDFLGWLSHHARAQGRPLKAGDVVITGARIGPLPLAKARLASAVAMSASVELTVQGAEAELGTS
ncbi:hydratase [Paracoccus sp. 11-3]|uniref:Hydratase n=1 Tax=Paracoccus amoyensis TaxID=2760093 RepID=A0A926GDC7_9RHOB|nr:fumarylacetoacetate hydrolase family protein [Paracoccus amoyensis]MBC9245309.1 hydratase [Paracoccus amoyensis]